ncbi:5'/3'-nucleotidase SurE [Carboxydochorda subterranea]|uniref:5'-nucleotidase SurE n=1 Tax=Carboxydichorda subterranea TaxID=3109565 RepID=A0ABZ1C0P7_9FIRM|nr:5'/3'-nucleotidase SurE [Limnochorda sp. L945t]WRP18524.1 5'/3'-nucleotidase SurE [Limnochorda sp. L945t]
MARILLSNDDGIDSPGLAALAEALDSIGQLRIVAPDRDRSATGHAITVRDALKVERRTLAGRWPAFAVSGTPADCVKLGVLELFPDPPDLVVSGINPGANLGIDVFYSGTVAAAAEGVLLGIAAVAISSITDKHAPRFDPARQVAPVIVQWMLQKRAEGQGVLLNVNVPDRVAHPVAALRWTRIGLNRRYRDAFEKPPDTDGHFRLVGDADEGDREDPTTDAGAVHRGYVSVTPMQFDLTDYEALARWGLQLGQPMFSTEDRLARQVAPKATSA